MEKRYDVGIHHADGQMQWLARNIDVYEAERVLFSARKPKGAKGVVKLRK